jgi:WD40 repeat protein
MDLAKSDPPKPPPPKKKKPAGPIPPAKTLKFVRDFKEFWGDAYPHKNRIRAIACGPKNQIFLAGDDDGCVIKWNYAKFTDKMTTKSIGHMMNNFGPIHDSKVTDIAITNCAYFFFSASMDESVIHYSMIEKKIAHREKFNFPIHAIALTPKNDALLIAVDSELHQYQLKDGFFIESKSHVEVTPQP